MMALSASSLIEAWNTYNEVSEQRRTDPRLVQLALERLRQDVHYQIPARLRLSFYGALEAAEPLLKIILSEQARCAVKAKPKDPLSELILSIVQKRPEITEAELLCALQECCDARKTVCDIDETTIRYDTHDQRLKEARISGLKDRLSRAKKEIKKSHSR